MFEFNQHESTRDATRIIYWIRVCVSLLKVAHAVDVDNPILVEDLTKHFSAGWDLRTVLRVILRMQDDVLDHYAPIALPAPPAPPKNQHATKRKEKKMRKSEESKKIGDQRRRKSMD
jgi:hypothetical protein